MIRSYRNFHPAKNPVIYPPGSQHNGMTFLLDGGSNKSVRSIEFPFRFFWTCLLTFPFGGLVFFDYVLPRVMQYMGGAR